MLPISISLYSRTFTGTIATTTICFPMLSFSSKGKNFGTRLLPCRFTRMPMTWPPIVGTKYKVIDGDKKLGNGISVVMYPGHTPGFQSVLIESPNKRILIASDTIPLFENWCQKPPLPSGVFNNLEQYYSTFDKISSLEYRSGIAWPRSEGI